MNRAMRFLARLFPSDWRKRYGVEFDALLEDAAPSARGALDVLCSALRMQMTTWNFRRIALAGLLTGIFASAAISFGLPAHYLSQMVLELTPADGSAPAGESVRLVDDMQQNLYTPKYLASVIDAHNLYWRERVHMPLDDVVAKMRKDINVLPVPRASSLNRDTATFVIQFDYSDPRVAQRITEELTSRFIGGGLNSELVSNWTFRVADAPSLPLRPAASNRARLTALGLFAGLIAGVSLAILLGSRRCRTAS